MTTAAATGDVVTGRDRCWRKAVRLALTENPVSACSSDKPQVPEFFRLVFEAVEHEQIHATRAPAGRAGPPSQLPRPRR